MIVEDLSFCCRYFGPIDLGKEIAENQGQLGRELWLCCWMVAMYATRLDALAQHERLKTLEDTLPKLRNWCRSIGPRLGLNRWASCRLERGHLGPHEWTSQPPRPGGD